MRTPPSESCRKVQGSRQARIRITSEQRTEGFALGCADLRPIPRIRVLTKSQNKSGTAEDFSPLSLIPLRDKGVFSAATAARS